MLTKVPKSSLPSSEMTSENIVLINGGNNTDSSVIVYEQARDFLSAPRCFAVIEFQLQTHGAIELDSDNEYEGIEYDEMGRMTEVGVFVMNDAEGFSAEEEEEEEEWQEGVQSEGQHVLISLANQRIEMLVDSIHIAGSYVARSAREALVAFLDNQDSAEP